MEAYVDADVAIATVIATCSAVMAAACVAAFTLFPLTVTDKDAVLSPVSVLYVQVKVATALTAKLATFTGVQVMPAGNLVAIATFEIGRSPLFVARAVSVNVFPGDHAARGVSCSSGSSSTCTLLFGMHTSNAAAALIMQLHTKNA